MTDGRDSNRRLAYAQDPDSHVVVDTETGFTFGEYISDQGITYRLAIPDQAPTTGGYDAVVQIAAPIAIGWAGMAWGGSMTYNPLTLAWRSGTDVIVSSRFALSVHSSTLPPPPSHTNTPQWLLRPTPLHGSNLHRPQDWHARQHHSLADNSQVYRLHTLGRRRHGRHGPRSDAAEPSCLCLLHGRTRDTSQQHLVLRHPRQYRPLVP